MVSRYDIGSKNFLHLTFDVTLKVQVYNQIHKNITHLNLIAEVTS